MQPPGDSVGLSNFGLTFYRGGPLCQPTYNWEMLVPGVCRALVLTPADKYTREGSFQPRLKLNPGLVPTGLLPMWQMTYGSATNRTSADVVVELFSQICVGEGAATRSTATATALPAKETFYQDLSRRCQLGFYQCGLDFGAKWGTNSHKFSLRFRIGRDQHTTPGRRRQPNI